ncbi:PmoA family protein [Conyzicola nivalis]|uniref:Methane monooxygenase PmoA-like n=1 Tax=Conyzicola nivalis TaxID=1477021 RepID=A0A916SMF6_9MICO|nr:PmoA family protein [Conyzicola nivalis]GGB07758.1 hypothetical protein GCM10010979_22850 [Conyzicola nivalis]
MTKYALDDRSDGSLVVSIGEVPVLTYVYRSGVAQLESPRPYFHPLTTLGGETVTQARPADHVWHHGLSWALPNVAAPGGATHNFWGGPTFVRGDGYVQLPNNGTVTHRGFTALFAGDDGVEIEEMLQWTAQDGALLFTEKRRLTVRASDDSWSLLFETVMRNASGETLSIGSPGTEGRENAGYGGLFWRGPQSMEGGEVLAEGDGGMGSRGAWMAYSAEAATVVMTDRAQNPRHPTPWFARSDEYAGLCPAPFFTEPLDAPAGAKVRFGYTVVIADGPSELGRASALAATAHTEKDPS